MEPHLGHAVPAALALTGLFCSWVKSHMGQQHKRGTGCISQINDHLWENRCSPTVNGKCMTRHAYLKTGEECKQLQAVLIQQIKAKIAAEKERLSKEKSTRKGNNPPKLHSGGLIFLPVAGCVVKLRNTGSPLGLPVPPQLLRSRMVCRLTKPNPWGYESRFGGRTSTHPLPPGNPASCKKHKSYL